MTDTQCFSGILHMSCISPEEMCLLGFVNLGFPPAQAYHAMAEGLNENAPVEKAVGMPSEELLKELEPEKRKPHMTLKRKLEEGGTRLGALLDQLGSIVSSDAPLGERPQDTFDIVYPWAPQLANQMPPNVQAMYT